MRSTGQDQQKKPSLWKKFHIDLPLLLGILLLMTLGLFIVYSASGQNMAMVYRHVRSIGVALIIMLVVAQIPPLVYRKWAVPVFVIGLLTLIAVLVFGHVGKGAQRWLDLGIIKFQPSEVMKLVVPIMIAWFISQENLPVKISTVFFAFILV